MSIKFHGARRVTYASLAFAFMAAVTLPVLATQSASAGTVTSRNIRMSSSTPGATSTTYTVSFNSVTTGNIGGIVVDFCGDSPVIGDSTCTLPTGFSLTASPGVANRTANIAHLGTAAQLNTNRTLVISGTPTSVTAGAISFDITTVTNPSTNNYSFYARIYTFASNTNATGYTLANAVANSTDQGGVALSTGRTYTVTAKVMETLDFCVYKTACGDDPNLDVGHVIGGGTTRIIDSSVVDTGTVTYSIGTNATTGAAVRLKGGVLTSGGNTIPGAGSGTTPANIVAGTAAFGVRVSTAGSMTAQAPYAAANYGFDDDTGGENVTTTYGDVLATIGTPVNNSVTTITYGATASNTTQPGIYQASHQLIATGLF